MNPTNKHHLVNDIYLSMQTQYSKGEMKGLFKRYGVVIDLSKTYTTEELKEALKDSDNKTVLQIAKDLNLSIAAFTEATSVNTEEAIKMSRKEDTKVPQQVFISHAEEDKEIIGDFIQILQAIGVSPEQIFCSSFEGYGTPLGMNFENDIKTRLNDNVLVLFIISNDFYNSPMCMLEMGAVWGLTKAQISVIIPPFKFEDMKGVFQNYQGVRIHEEKQLDLLKETLEDKLKIKPIKSSIWSHSRDSALNNIKAKLENKNS